MAPKKKKASTPGAGTSASAAAAAGKLYELGPPYGKVHGISDDPWAAVGKQVRVPGAFWDKTDKANWLCAVAAYQHDFPFAKGKAPAYYVENGGFHYPMPAPMLAKFLPKGAVPDYVDSDDEAPQEEDDDEDAAPKKTRKTKSGGKATASQAEYDHSRPAAAVADEINDLITQLHGERAAKCGDDSEVECVQGSRYKKGHAPTGWKSTAAQVKAALVGLACPCASGPRLKNPLAQGITRTSAQKWRLVDSFNLVYPTALREMVTEQTCDYWDYQHELGAQGSTPKIFERLWPEGGITREHYDAYIAVVGAMGIVRLPSIYDYWSTNGKRFTTLTRELFMMIRHYLHFRDARKKVIRGDRSQPPPPGYDPIYNFRPLMDGFNKAWSSLVTLSDYLTIDEKMIKLAMHIGLSRRQPNKPIRDGLQARPAPLPAPASPSAPPRPSCPAPPVVPRPTRPDPAFRRAARQVYVLSESKGHWVYYTWIDQGEGDPNLKPPYHFGKTVAIILYLLAGAGVFGTWCTVVMDQYFTSPTLLVVLTFLKVFCIGTCQTNRRGWPSTQLKETEEADGKVKEPGDVIFKHEVGSSGAIKWAMTALKWYDKNEVHIATNCSAADVTEYQMKKKGEVDAIETEQPVARKLYCAHKVGVDVVDQTDASNISDHGSKKNPWHRPHDAYVNTAMNLTFEHYAMVIEAYGDEPQEKELKRLRHDAHEARWQLLEQLTENAKFGVEQPCISSQVSNLRRGGGRPPRKDDSEDDSEEEEPAAATPAPRRTGRTPPPPPETPPTQEAPQQRRTLPCDFGLAVKHGICGLQGCNNHPKWGCKTHGLRLCWPECVSKHVQGVGISRDLRAEIEWVCGECKSK